MPNRTFVRSEVHRAEAVAVPASAKGPTKKLVVEGQQWVAYEAPDPFNNTATLIFIGPGTARRVRDFSANWRDLSDIELYALSWER